MDTIFAIATAPVKSGVAIMRISGPNAKKALKAIIKTKIPKARTATLTKLYNPNNNELIDEALIIIFDSPASFTGEDIVELHIHGSRAVINELTSCLIKIKNLRHAEAGEFSRRAFLNNKMDLTQAEGLADLIDAETKMQAKLAMRLKQGETGLLYDNWRANILKILANIEAYIDFPDEDIPTNVINIITTSVTNLISSIKKYLDDNKRGEIIRQGLNIAIIGPPNAGKSSLMNILAKREVSIVSKHAGTTRDIIETQLDLGGYPITISDSAGIRRSDDSIESEGIKRALKRAQIADLRIVVLNALDYKEKSSIGKLPFEIQSEDILVINKIDLLNKEQNLPSLKNMNPIFSSFKNGQAIDTILKNIQNFAEDNFSVGNDPLITRARHRDLLNNVVDSLENFSLDKNIELSAEDLRMGAYYLGQITGKINVEEILGEIFSNFCIGK